MEETVSVNARLTKYRTFTITSDLEAVKLSSARRASALGELESASWREMARRIVFVLSAGLGLSA